MKRTIIAAAILALGTAGAGVSLAEPGPNGSNNHGLCTAYGHNGGGNSHNSPPFAELQRQADEAGDGNGEATAEEIAEFCAPFLGGNGNENGNNGNPKAGRSPKG